MRRGRPGSVWLGRWPRRRSGAWWRRRRRSAGRRGIELRPICDAMLLARLLRMDEIVAVTVPSVEQEDARDLVRAREDVRGDLMRSRHRVSKLLLRQGIVYC